MQAEQARQRSPNDCPEDTRNQELLSNVLVVGAEDVLLQEILLVVLVVVRVCVVLEAGLGYPSATLHLRLC